jgi:hypothetical protein
MAQSSELRATPSRSSPCEWRPGRLSSETSRAPADWPGPHLARLNAWAARRQRILMEIAQRARTLDRQL